MLRDVLRDTWAYKEIMQEGREEGLQQGLQEGLQQGVQEGSREALRQMLVSYIESRFPALVPMAREQVLAVNDPAVLQNAIVRLFAVQTSQDAEQTLLALGADAGKN